MAIGWMATASPRSHPVVCLLPGASTTHKSVHEVQDMSTSHAFSPPTHTHTSPQEMSLYSFLVGASLMGSVVGFMPSMRVQQRGLGKCLGWG